MNGDSLLKGKVALVTGGARGIGRSISEALIGSGATVAICGRSMPTVLPVALGHEAEFHVCDVRQADAVSAMISDIEARHGRLDIVVNNAGGSPKVDAAAASPRLSEAIIALNLTAPLHVATAAHRVMCGQGTGGLIVNIASLSGTRPSPGTAAYGAAKAGLLNLTKSLAMEWGPAVRVNAIVVGLIDMQGGEDHYGGEESRARISAMLPMGRMGRGEDVAAAVLYFASPLAAYVTGAELEIHGGGERPAFLDLVAS